MCAQFSPHRGYKLEARPQRITVTENHTHLFYTVNTSTHSILHIYTPCLLICSVLVCLFCFVFLFKVCVSRGSRSHSPRPNMSHTTGHVGHWEDLETWLSIATDSLLPKAAETLKHQTQDQLDDNITSLMAQDPSHSYNHKELAKITGSLSHTLIATLKLSDKHAAQRQQGLTRAQRRIEQLELEAQERREGSDEAEQGAEEEINRLKETLAATSQELEQVKADYDDRSEKLQYAEQLLEKAKADFRDKNGRIKALEAHLDESRNKISRLTRQLDYVKEESDSFQEELKHAYELRREPSRTRRAPTSPLPSRTGSPVPGLTREKKREGVVLKHSPTHSGELYLTLTQPKESAAASHRSSHGLDLKDLDKLTRNIGKFTQSMPNSPNVQAYLQDIDFHLEMRPNVTDKDRLYLLRMTSSSEVLSFLDRQPAHTKMITNCSEKPSLKSSPTLSPNKASWLPWRQDKYVTNLLKPTTADSDGHTLELATNLTWRMN